MAWSPSKATISIEASAPRLRAWERQPRTTVDKRGRPKTIYKRYAAPSSSSTVHCESSNQSPHSTQKVLKKVKVAGLPNATPSKRTKGVGVAAKFDRRKSALRHKEPVLIVEKLDESNSAHEQGSDEASHASDAENDEIGAEHQLTDELNDRNRQNDVKDPEIQTQDSENTLSAIDLSVFNKELSEMTKLQDEKAVLVANLTARVDALLDHQDIPPAFQNGHGDDLTLDLGSYLSRSKQDEDTLKVNERSICGEENRDNVTLNSPQAKQEPEDSEPLDDETNEVQMENEEQETETPLGEETTTTITINLNDDEDMLRDFLNRSKASKAAKIARRSSLSHRRDSDIVKRALASPHRQALEDLDANSPSPSKKNLRFPEDDTLTSTSPTPNTTQRSMHDPPATTDDDELAADAQTLPMTRRSNRRAAPRKSMTLQTPSSLLCRGGGNEGSGDNTITLKKSAAQELANMTRSNTRRNKGNALPVRSMLVKLKKEVGAEDVSPDQKPGKGKAVTWNEDLVYFFEDQSGVTDTDALATQTAPEPRTEQATASKPRSRRAKTLGAMNGTPAKSKVSSTSGTVASEAALAKEIVAAAAEAKALQQRQQEEQQLAQASMLKPTKLFANVNTNVAGGAASKDRKIPALATSTRARKGDNKENSSSQSGIANGENTAMGEKKGLTAASTTRRSILPRYSTRARA